jgi:hypothetical protein
MNNILLKNNTIYKTGYKNNYVQTSFSSKNKKVIIYENKIYPVFIFNNDIYKYLFKAIYDKTYEYIKNIYNKDSSNIINLFDFKKIKKYKENIKKRKRQKIKKQKEKEKPLLTFEEKYINVKILNNEKLIEIIDCGFISVKVWPIKYELYKDILSYKILYFHNYYNMIEKDKPSVTLFYKINGVFNSEMITYKDLYALFIKEYNNKSVYNFIKKYYAKFNILC